MKDNELNLTDLEKNLLKKIALDDYTPTNGRRPETFEECGETWAFVLDSKSDGGVFASLKTKGLVDYNRVSARDKAHGDGDTLWLTEAGFDAFDKAFPL